MLKPVKRPKSPFYVLRGTVNGIRYERSTGTASLTEARKLIPQFLADITESKQPATWRDMSFASAIIAYLDNGGEDRHLSRLLEWFGNTRIGDIDNAAMSRAAAALYPNAAPATVRRQLYTPVKAIINFVSDVKLRAPKGDARRTDWLWPEQAERIIRALQGQPNSYTPALVTFLFGQGCRMGEAMKLQASDVHLAGRIAIIRDPKNGHERTIHLTSRVIAALSVLPTINDVGPIFRRTDGSAFKPRVGRNGGQIRGPFARAVIAAGLDPKRITPHVCRHTWATWFYAATLDPLRLKAEGGWQSNEYQRYTHLVSAELLPEIMRYGWAEVGENRGKVRVRAYKSMA